MSALEAESTTDTITFEHFGREWSVPAKRHLSHLKKLRDGIRFSDPSMLIAETFLSAEQFDALLEIDPVEDDLDEFARVLSAAMGFGDSGNS